MGGQQSVEPPPDGAAGVVSPADTPQNALGGVAAQGMQAPTLPGAMGGGQIMVPPPGGAATPQNGFGGVAAPGMQAPTLPGAMGGGQSMVLPPGGAAGAASAANMPQNALGGMAAQGMQAPPIGGTNPALTVSPTNFTGGIPAGYPAGGNFPNESGVGAGMFAGGQAASANPAMAGLCPCQPLNGSAGAVGTHHLQVIQNSSDVTTPVAEGWAFMEQKRWLIFLLLLELIIVLGLYAYHRLWTRAQRRRAKKKETMKQSNSYAIELVRHLLPSVMVEKYRFQGMGLKSLPMSIAFEDLGLELHNGSRVLEGVSGELKAGHMCAIMGPSGAGKTTFMNVLCGKASYGRVTGKVFINDEEGDISAYKSVTGFVPQDDIVHENLTVGEQIGFSAQLRNPPWTSIKKIRMVTEDVLTVMQIDHIRDSIVGGVEQRGISGGQRKRVNIGLELAANPTVLFLDEPTSGLDATTSLTIVNSLKKMTHLGMTAIMVIHQPRYSLFTLFDDVLLLGKGGRTVYLGPSLGAKPFFEDLGFAMAQDENPADWLMDVISGEVENKSISDFQPVMLFSLWEKMKQEVSKYTSRVRTWTAHDDRAALAGKLEEEWDKIDIDGSGTMEEDELNRLLTLCMGSEPDEEVVSQLFKQIAGGDAEVVTRREFLNFVVGLQQVTAAAHTGQSHVEDTTDESEADVEAFVFDQAVPIMTGGGAPRKATRFDPREGCQHQVGCRRQLVILMHRQLIRWWRSNGQRGIFLGVVLLAAVVLSIMDRFLCEEPDWAAEPFLNLHTALALLTSVYSLGLFGRDRPVFWRESFSGLNVLSFFASRIFINAFDLVLQCFLFAAVYYLIRQPSLVFGYFFVPFCLTSFTASGVGYLISAVLPPQHGPFVAALVIFVSCGLLGHPLRVGKLQDGGFLEATVDLFSITRWSVGMSFLKNLDETHPSNLDWNDKGEIMALEKYYRTDPMWQASLGYWWTGISFIFGMGTVLYTLSFVGLKYLNRGT